MDTIADRVLSHLQSKENTMPAPSPLHYLKTTKESLHDALSSLTMNKAYDAAHTLLDAIKLVDQVIESQRESGLYMGLTKTERDLIQGNQWIDAIKSVRARTKTPACPQGISLKEAKDMVVAYRDTLAVVSTDQYGNASSYEER